MSEPIDSNAELLRYLEKRKRILLSKIEALIEGHHHETLSRLETYPAGYCEYVEDPEEEYMVRDPANTWPAPDVEETELKKKMFLEWLQNRKTGADLPDDAFRRDNLY